MCSSDLRTRTSLTLVPDAVAQHVVSVDSTDSSEHPHEGAGFISSSTIMLLLQQHELFFLGAKSVDQKPFFSFLSIFLLFTDYKILRDTSLRSSIFLRR